MPINILHEETQGTITKWASEVFGEPRDALVIYDRMLKEVEELRWELLLEVGEESNTRAIGRELADIAVFMLQLAERTGVDLYSEIDDKMAVNRGRNWVVTDEGVGQHV